MPIQKSHEFAADSVLITRAEFLQAIKTLGIEIPENASVRISAYDPVGKMHGLSCPLDELDLVVAWSGEVNRTSQPLLARTIHNIQTGGQ